MGKVNHRIKVFTSFVVALFGTGFFLSFRATDSVFQSPSQSNTSRRYTISLIQGQIPPRFDIHANNGFGDARFLFQYPLTTWIGIPAVLLGLNGHTALSLQFIAMIGFFVWGLLKVEQLFKTRYLSLARIALLSMAMVTLELINKDITVKLMILPWLVWAVARFVKARQTQGHYLWLRVLSQDGLLVVLVVSIGLLASSDMIIVCFGLVLGVMATATQTVVKQLILCLLWALANTAWFWLPRYIERAEVFVDPSSENYISKSFDAQKANAIFDDYPNQKVISPNAAVKIIPNQKKWGAHTYTIIVPEPSLLIEKTMYYPGWQVVANGKPVVLENPASTAGLVTYTLDAGIHEVKSGMTQRTIPRMIGNSLSLVGIATWMWLVSKATNNKHKSTRNLLTIFWSMASNKQKLTQLKRIFWRQRNQ